MRCADLRRRDGADRERVGQRDRRLQHAQLVHLHQADALAEAVDDDGRRRHLVQERIAAHAAARR